MSTNAAHPTSIFSLFNYLQVLMPCSRCCPTLPPCLLQELHRLPVGALSTSLFTTAPPLPSHLLVASLAGLGQGGAAPAVAVQCHQPPSALGGF